LEKRIGKTDKDFEEWMIDHLYPLRGANGSIVYLSNMAVRDIIVTSLGGKPTIDDLLMPIDSFVHRYINEDYNPTINIYFAATVSKEHRKGYDNHLLMEGFAFRLTGEEGRNMIDEKASYDFIMNKFSYRSIEDPSIYKGRTAWRLLGNYASLCFALGRTLRMDVVSAEILMRPEAYIHTLTEKDRESLKKAAGVLRKGLMFSNDPRILATLFIELRGIYSILGEVENLVAIIDRFLESKNYAIFHLFKGQALLDELNLGTTLTENKKEKLSSTSEKEFEEVVESSGEAVVAAYLGLLNLYSTVGDSEKMHSLALNLLGQPDIYRAIFSYNLRYDTSKAIYLLEQWKEANPYDKEAASLLERLRNSTR